MRALSNRVGRYKGASMPCPFSGRVVELESLTAFKNAEFLPEHVVSANKLSITKFVCPGCSKSVDVSFKADGTVRIRDHAAKGERVVGGGLRPAGMRTVSLSSMAELVAKQRAIHAEQMAKMLVVAEDNLKSFDAKIEFQVGLIKQAETRIAELNADKAKAEELLTAPEFAQFRKTGS